MQKDASISFEPIPPAPLEPWQVLLACVFFLGVIAGIVWKRRRRTEDSHNTLDLGRK